MAIRYGSALDRTFHALGDGTRRRMLSHLAKRGECTAGDLGAPFAIAQPTASRHLQVLERAGLVTRRVRGREHVFRIRPKGLEQAQSWIARHQAFWAGTLDRLGATLAEMGDA